MVNHNSENHDKKVSHSYSTQDLLMQVIREKLRKMKNSSDSEQNSTEVSKDIPQKVVKVGEKDNPNVEKTNRKNSTTNISQYYQEKSQENSTTFTTSPGISPKTSVENSSTITQENVNSSIKTQENEEEGVEIENNTIIIKGKKGYRFEIQYDLVGTIEDMTRIRDLKIPQLPRYELKAKKKGETLNLLVTVDFFTSEGKAVYYIRNKKEVVERLYAFRGEKHISKKLIGEALDVWLSHIQPESKIQWKDITEVVTKYKEWEEINRDPVQFFLDQSSDVVGNEKLKIAVLLSVVSSQLTKLKRGIYRIHLILTGSSGAGKSSTIKSILDLFYNNMDGVEDWIVLTLTRMTKEALGRLDIDTMDGKVFFIEQLDNVEGVDYIREAMSEGYISTLTTVKDEDGNLVPKTIVIPGQPAFISTNVSANVDHQIMNRSIQLYLSPGEDEKLKKRIMKSILFRDEASEEDISRLKLITYVWLKSRPKSPKMTEDIGYKVIDVLSKFINFRNINRATEITRNLLRASASMFGREQITSEDLDFVTKYFKKDIILTTLELSERDLQLLRWLRDHGFVQAEREDETRDIPTSEIAQVIKLSTQETKEILNALYDKGLVWKAYDGKKFTWAISHYGLRVLEELEKEVEEVRSEEGKKEEGIDVMIDDGLLSVIMSKLVGKGVITDEELRGILQRVAQATDPDSQNLLITALEKMNFIKPNGDGTWKVH